MCVIMGRGGVIVARQIARIMLMVAVFGPVIVAMLMAMGMAVDQIAMAMGMRMGVGMGVAVRMRRVVGHGGASAWVRRR